MQQADVPVQVAVIDRLPVPFGLVRYGVAPDHPSIRSIRHTLERTLERSGVRFYGDVGIGEDLTVEELRGVVDAVVYAYGAGSDKALGIPGEDLEGSIAAPELVAWYCGHPDVHPDLEPDPAAVPPDLHPDEAADTGVRPRRRHPRASRRRPPAGDQYARRGGGRGQRGPRRGTSVDQDLRPVGGHRHGRRGAGDPGRQPDPRRTPVRSARTRVHGLHHQGTARTRRDRGRGRAGGSPRPGARPVQSGRGRAEQGRGPQSCGTAGLG